MEFVAGVDGGGTKTECVLLDLEGREFARERLGSMNMNSRPEEEVRATLRGVAELIRSQDGTCRMLIIGCAGAGNAALRSAVDDMLSEIGYHVPHRLVGDQTIALYAAHEGAPGAVLISGTGSICVGRDADGREVRAGGCGYKIDDEGSGYAIGRDILAAVVRAADGRIPATALTALVEERIGAAGVPALIRTIYAKGGQEVNLASFADLLPAALAAGDAAANAILEKAVEELCLIVSAVLDRLDLPTGPLAFTGGMLLNQPALADGVAARLTEAHPGFRCFPLRVSAATGAAHMALDAVKNG